MPSGPSRRDGDTAMLYLHGGAFVVCGLGTHRSIAARLARAKHGALAPIGEGDGKALHAAGMTLS